MVTNNCNGTTATWWTPLRVGIGRFQQYQFGSNNDQSITICTKKHRSMPSFTRERFWTVVLCALLCFPSGDAQSCTLCVDGSDPPNPDLQINGVNCSNMMESIIGTGISNVSSTCTSFRATFGVYCGCPVDLGVPLLCRLCGEDVLLPDPEFQIATPPVSSIASDTCLELEFMGMENSNTDGELSCESLQSNYASSCCSASARPTRSPVIREDPTVFPTTLQRPSHVPSTIVNVPTITPTMTPSNTQLTYAPTETPIATTGPTPIPSSTQLTFIPTTVLIPTSSPTNMEVDGNAPATMTPTTTITTQHPAMDPTMRAPMIQIGVRFSGITLTLPGVEQLLTENAQNNFESALQGWYRSIYEIDGSSSASRRRRMMMMMEEANHQYHHHYHHRDLQLQQKQLESLLQFQTRVLYVSQFLDENTRITTVTYDQTVSFVQTQEEPPADVRQLLLDPFDDEGAVRQLLDRLLVSDPFFESIEGDLLTAPHIPPPDYDDNNGNDDDQSDGFNLGLVLGVIAAGLILFAIVLYLVTKPSQKEENAVINHAFESKVAEDLANVNNDERDATGIVETVEEMDEERINSKFSTQPTPTSLPVVPPKLQIERNDDDDDESIPTNKQEYSRAKFLGPGPDLPDEDFSPTVSTASASRQTTNSSWMGVLGLESSANESQEPEPTPQETYEVIVPPGKLGVVIDTPSENPPTVFAVKGTSPLFGKVEVGDFLIQVDDEDVSTFSAVKVSKLIGSKAKNPERRFVLSRTLSTSDKENQ